MAGSGYSGRSDYLGLPVVQAVSIILVIPVTPVVLVVLVLILSVVPDVLFPSGYSSTVVLVAVLFRSGSVLNKSTFYLLLKNSPICFVRTVWKWVHKMQDDG